MHWLPNIDWPTFAAAFVASSIAYAAGRLDGWRDCLRRLDQMITDCKERH